MRKSQKLRYLMTGVILFAMTWLGYWIGYVSTKRTLDAEIQDVQMKHLEPSQQERLANKHKMWNSRSKHQYKATSVLPVLHNNNKYGAVESVKGIPSKSKVKSPDSNSQKDQIYKQSTLSTTTTTTTYPYLTKTKSQQKVDKLYQNDSQVNRNRDNPVENSKHSDVQKKAQAPTEYKKLKGVITGFGRGPGNPNKTQKKKKPRLSELYPPSTKKPQIYPRISSNEPFYILSHSKNSAKIHKHIHAKLRLMDPHISPGSYIFTASGLPKERRYWPSIGNGNLGTAVHAREVFMNGVYSGFGNKSHRAVIPSTCSMNITSTDPPSVFKRNYTLNVGSGIYEECSEHDGKNYTFCQRIYAHRNITQLLVVEIDLIRTNASQPLMLKVSLNRWRASRDITFLHEENHTFPEASYKYGKINSPETQESGYTTVHIVYDHIPEYLEPPSGAPRTKWVFLTSIGTRKSEAFEGYQKGMKLAVAHDQLYAQHVEAWASLWKRGRIDVTGNERLAKAIYGSFYYIYSSLPLKSSSAWPFIGLSPTGLAYGNEDKDYNGHVFWDQEVWMYPPVLTFHHDLARMILDTRKRTSQQASKNAELNKRKGLQFPWESAFTGVEVCDNSTFAKDEIHISGGISLAILNYLYATNDTKLLTVDGFINTITGIANFYASFLSPTQSGKYTINGVMPPDEYHDKVNDSVYTNVIAKIALGAPYEAYRMLNKTITNWQQFVEDMYIPYDNINNYHPEYKGYKRGTKVKQADAVMLSYPLMRELQDLSLLNDLKIYEKVTDVAGPAMSWPVFAIGWLQLGKVDRAEQFFKRNFDYIKGDFQVWSETVINAGDGTNFITGMGGFLQAIINGYGGFRIHKNRLDLNPVLPPGTEGVHFVNIDYLGNELDLTVSGDSMQVTVTACDRFAPKLNIMLYKSEKIYTLELNQAVKVERAKAVIYASHIQIPEKPP